MKRKFTVTVEHASGEPFNLKAWCRDALKYQDMAAWEREDPVNFKHNVQVWVKAQLTIAIENLDVVVKEVIP